MASGLISLRASVIGGRQHADVQAFAMPRRHVLGAACRARSDDVWRETFSPPAGKAIHGLL